MFRCVRFSLVIAGGYLLACCGKSPAPENGAVPAPTAEPFRIASVFPPGPGQEKVLSSCGSCHSVVCAASGQKSAERWESIKTGHMDKMTGVSVADLNAMFRYLAANFNDSKPEPKIPAELMQQGCTPF
ncbi:MAG: hypothetical protein HY235_26585 [Acidobacteria bacterium]|nr:hypothetical protein [Acidobacteriota bacterium]